MQKKLRSIGLTKNEAKVYEELAREGQCKAGLLINRLDIHRNIVYQSLESLIHKGLAAKIIKRGVRHYQITDPNSLLSSLRRKESLIESVIQEIQTFQHASHQQIVVYEGIESYRQYWVDSLKRFPEGTIDYTAFAPTNYGWAKVMGRKAHKEYMDLRIKKKIKWKTIHFDIKKGEKEMLKRYPNITEYRLLKRSLGFIGNFNVIHDTVILHVFKEPYRIIEIRDKDLVSVFRIYFNILWEQAKPIKA